MRCDVHMTLSQYNLMVQCNARQNKGSLCCRERMCANTDGIGARQGGRRTRSRGEGCDGTTAHGPWVRLIGWCDSVMVHYYNKRQWNATEYTLPLRLATQTCLKHPRHVDRRVVPTTLCRLTSSEGPTRGTAPFHVLRETHTGHCSV